MKNPSCEVLMNDVEIKIYVKEKKNLGFQTQESVVFKDEITKLQLQKLMDQKRIWKGWKHKCIVLGFLLHE